MLLQFEFILNDFAKLSDVVAELTRISVKDLRKDSWSDTVTHVHFKFNGVFDVRSFVKRFPVSSFWVWNEKGELVDSFKKNDVVAGDIQIELL